jgi:hypothetical protein
MLIMLHGLMVYTLNEHSPFAELSCMALLDEVKKYTLEDTQDAAAAATDSTATDSTAGAAAATTNATAESAELSAPDDAATAVEGVKTTVDTARASGAPVVATDSSVGVATNASAMYKVSRSSAMLCLSFKPVCSEH